MHAPAIFLVLSFLVFGEVTATCKPIARQAYDCRKICENTINCYYFTWNRVNYRCFLKVRIFNKIFHKGIFLRRIRFIQISLFRQTVAGQKCMTRMLLEAMLENQTKKELIITVEIYRTANYIC